MKAMLLVLSLLSSSGDDVQGDLELIKKTYDDVAVFDMRHGPLKSVALIKDDLISTAHRVNRNIVDYDTLREVVEANSTSWHPALTFTTIVLVTASILIVLALVMLFSIYFGFLIREVPVHVWHILAWVLCTILCYAGNDLGDLYLATVLPGCVGMIGCCILTDYLFFSHLDDADSVLAMLLTFIWGAWAVHYESHLLGFMSATSLMVGLGFIAGHLPGMSYVGFRDLSAVMRATIAAGVMLMIHIYLTVTHADRHDMDVFRTGASFMGSFVFYLGLIILASKWCWYDRTDKVAIRHYITMQAITIVCGVGALWLGSVYGMTTLLGIGGTFFYLYLIEKYYEIPWKGVGWVWSTLGLGGVLYGFSVFASAHPQYFLFM